MDSIIIKLDERKNYNVKEVGGKGNSLMLMKKKGINIPTGFIIATSCFRKYYSSNGDIVIDKKDQEVILDAYDSIITEGTVAVRSSATNEDQAAASYAGQYESVLYVKRNEIFDAIIKVWKSIDVRSNSYSVDTQTNSAEMAIVVQKMLFPDISGVIFTRYPYLNSNSVNIEIVKGGLNKLVSGSISPSNYIINRNTQEYIHSGEICGDIMNIYEWGLQIEKLYGVPSDIEWAMSKNELFLLQVRNITSGNKEKLFDTFYGSKNIFDQWTRGNVSEVLPSEMTPFSWSIWGEILNNLLQKSFRHLPEKYNVFNTCFIRMNNGKLEYNIGAINYFTHTIMGFPSMNEVIGGNHIKDMVNCDSQQIYWLRIIKNMKSIKRNSETFAILPKLSKTKYIEIDDKVKNWNYIDLSMLSNEKLFSLFDEMLLYGVENMSLHTDATSASFSYVSLLKYFLKRWVGSDDLVIQLISDIEDIEIAYLGDDIQKILILIDSKPDKISIINALKSEKWESILKDADEEAVLSSVYKLIEKYGHRGNSELEFAVANWKEDPRYLLNIIVNTYNMGNFKRVNDNKEEFEKAKEVLDEKFRFRKFKYNICKELISKSREYTRLRENNKHHLYLIIAQIRRVTKEILNRLSQNTQGIEKYAYFIQIEEIREYLLNGKKLPESMIIRRYLEYQEYKLNKSIWDKKCLGDFKSLHGFPACMGIVTAKVRILKDLDEIEKLKEGEILVVKTMDIGWSPVFSRIAGLITEIGGTLSHAAIVAREYGIPTIVNVPAVTDLLRDGDMVVLNANTGVVEKIDEQ